MDRLVTLFGGGGFIGRYVAQALYKTGVRVRIAQRDPRRAWFLKPLGALGQTQFVAVDIRDQDQVARAIDGSSAVINLVGVLKGDFQGLHVDGARNIAQAARATGAETLVHVSAIGADRGSPSAYGRSKGEGEEAVKAVFPDATILRPSVAFGQEDDFVNRFARLARFMPALPVVRGETKLQPVFVGDVGKAAADAALDPRRHGGKAYELGGPQTLSLRDLNSWICEATGRNAPIIDIPDSIAAPLVRLTGWLPGAPITWDQWLMLGRDNVVADGAEGLGAFGITPTPLSAVATGWLIAYRRRGRFGVKSPY